MTPEDAEYLRFLQELDACPDIGPDDMTDFELDFMGSNLSAADKFGEKFRLSDRQKACLDKIITKFSDDIGFEFDRGVKTPRTLTKPKTIIDDPHYYEDTTSQLPPDLF